MEDATASRPAGGVAGDSHEEVSTTYQPRFDDHQRVAVEFARIVGGFGRLFTRWTLYLLLGSMAGLGAISLLPARRAPDRDKAIALAAGIFGSFVGMAWELKRNRAVLGNRIRQTPNLQGPQTCTFGPGGMTLRMPHSTTTSTWSAFLDVLESPDYFLFRFGPRSLHALPKWTLQTDDRIQTVRALLERHLGPRFRR